MAHGQASVEVFELRAAVVHKVKDRADILLTERPWQDPTVAPHFNGAELIVRKQQVEAPQHQRSLPNFFSDAVFGCRRLFERCIPTPFRLSEEEIRVFSVTEGGMSDEEALGIAKAAFPLLGAAGMRFAGTEKMEDANIVFVVGDLPNLAAFARFRGISAQAEEFFEARLYQHFNSHRPFVPPLNMGDTCYQEIDRQISHQQTVIYMRPGEISHCAPLSLMVALGLYPVLRDGDSVLSDRAAYWEPRPYDLEMVEMLYSEDFPVNGRPSEIVAFARSFLEIQGE